LSTESEGHHRIALTYRADEKLASKLLRGSFFCSTPAEPFFRSLIATTNASTFFLADLLSCLGTFFCSTAPQAFFCPDRRFPTPTRAEAVKVGRRSAIAAHSAVSRPRLDSFEHGGRLDDHGPEERSVVGCGSPLVFARVGLMSLPDPPFSTRSRVAGRIMALRVSTPLCPERTQQEIGAGRIARSSRPVPAGTAFRREVRRRRTSIGLRRLEGQLRRSIGTSCPWSTCDAG
jgi:hypothetical protein